MTSSNILITGGAGFIGTHLAERLKDTARLVLFDNLRRNSLSGVPSLQNCPDIEFQQGDVLKREELDRAVKGATTVLHLAAIAGVSSYYSQPLDTLRVNILGTVNVLEAAAAAGVKRFVYLSTSEVFGPDAMGVREDSPHHIGNVSDRRWVYATSKLAGEQLVMRYSEAYGLNGTILRPFNIYGPRQTGEGAISNFCTAALKGEPLTVYGDGSAVRAWCYISDFVDGVMAVLDQPEAVGQDFNIGNPSEVETTLGLARRVANLVPGSRIESKEVQRAEVRGRVPVIDKAKRLLHFEPKIDLNEGLRRTLDWYRSQVKE